MLEPVSVLLKFGFLLVLYLFLLWVSRSALRDLRRKDAAPVKGARSMASAPGPLSEGTALHSAASGIGSGLEETEALLRVESGAGLERGSAFDLVGGAVMGRGDQVDIRLEDPFASTRHARLAWEGSVVVIEDMGSTNGTYLNGELLQGPQPVHLGDRIRIGDTEFSLVTEND